MSKMLDVKIVPHRNYLMADIPDQKLFIELKLSSNKLNLAAAAFPDGDTVNNTLSASPLSIIFVVDTSGSMREIVSGSTKFTGQTQTIDGNTYNLVTGGESKIGIIIDGLKKFVGSSKLKKTDRISIVKFDDDAKVLLPFTNADDENKNIITKSIENLLKYSGGTSMGAGLKTALELMSKETANRRIIMFTDGQTSDDDLARETAANLARENTPVIAIGIGEDWNEDLITFITDKTQGKPFYATTDTTEAAVMPDANANNKIVSNNININSNEENDWNKNKNYINDNTTNDNNNSNNNNNIAIKSSDIPEVMIKELDNAVSESLTGVSLTINAVHGVKIDRITRVYPEVSEADINIKPHSLGNISETGGTVFIIETTIPERKPLKSRLMQLSLTYNAPGINFREENPPEDVIVEFTTNESKASVIDQEVMQWVQQRNVGGLVEKAIKESVSNPSTAAKTLDMARRMTVKLGNGAMTRMIEQAQNEIKESKTISIGTSKTLRIGSRTKTVKLDSGQGLSDEQIRKLTGI